jgi:hypothetical protein
MDKLFDAPNGPISPWDFRAAVAKEIRDPEVEAFQNLRRMSADEIANNNKEQRQ